jgi:antirestriction protein ArdC
MSASCRCSASTRCSNVAQCEGLPASIIDGKPARVRNPHTRDPLADEFPAATRAVIREGTGEAYYAPGQDFISLPAFAAFRGADDFYNVAFHELAALCRVPDYADICFYRARRGGLRLD